MEFVREARLRKAAALLSRTDLPIKAVAGRAGFSSRTHFSEAFSKQYGSPPSHFRASYTNDGRTPPEN